MANEEHKAGQAASGEEGVGGLEGVSAEGGGAISGGGGGSSGGNGSASLAGDEDGKGGSILVAHIEREMREAYIDYSMSVIVSRAIPDVRDGLKPVHRRVLYGMYELGVMSNRAYKKSARIVGEVLGKYHPHGDTSVYDTMVRMAQDWSLRYPLVDGQGNFGSIDGDSPAAMRYTEARLKRMSEDMLADINKETVDYQPNFDDSLQEPTVLPSRVPNLLLNGSSGIAVGMATHMPPHNLRELVQGLIAYIENPEIDTAQLMEFIKAPDFPTGGIIYGYQGVKDAFATGRGRIVVRGKAQVEEDDRKARIVVSEIPFMVNKAQMIEKTAELVNAKKVEGISDIRDESDRDGLRVVYDLKREAVPSVVLNNLYKHTALQTSFSVNNVALVKGRPATLNLKDLLRHYVDHQHEVLLRRLNFDLKEYEKRLHILEGYLIVLRQLDAVIKLIRGSTTPETAKQGLMRDFKLSERQSQAILDMRLQKLTGLEREKVKKEHADIVQRIQEIKAVLDSRTLQMERIKNDLKEVGERYGDERKTEIDMYGGDFTMEDMVPNDSMVVTVSRGGYIKRTALSDYRVQGRGGVGARGVNLKEDDSTQHLFVANNHDYLLIFTSAGKLYWLKVYSVPEGSRTAKGRPIQNMIQVETGESIQTVLKVSDLKDAEYTQSHYLVMATRKGKIKKTILSAYARPNRRGIRAIVLTAEDSLLSVCLTNGAHQILFATREGRALRFSEEEVRPLGRTAQGVGAIQLRGKEDAVVSMVCVEDDKTQLLVVSEHGFGKCSAVAEYRQAHRRGQGVVTLQTTQRIGKLVDMKGVLPSDELLIMTQQGTVIRISVKEVKMQGRATQGVRLVRLRPDDAITSVEKIPAEEEAVKNP